MLMFIRRLLRTHQDLHHTLNANKYLEACLKVARAERDQARRDLEMEQIKFRASQTLYNEKCDEVAALVQLLNDMPNVQRAAVAASGVMDVAQHGVAGVYRTAYETAMTALEHRQHCEDCRNKRPCGEAWPLEQAAVKSSAWVAQQIDEIALSTAISHG